MTTRLEACIEALREKTFVVDETGTQHLAFIDAIAIITRILSAEPNKNEIERAADIIMDEMPDNFKPCNSAGERLKSKDIKQSPFWHIENYHSAIKSIAKAALMTVYGGELHVCHNPECHN